jgi:hypothetical protein
MTYQNVQKNKIYLLVQNSYMFNQLTTLFYLEEQLYHFLKHV